MGTNTLSEVHDTFHTFAGYIMAKAKKQKMDGIHDPSHERTIQICQNILDRTSGLAKVQKMAVTGNRALFLGIISATTAAMLMVNHSPAVDGVRQTLFNLSVVGIIATASWWNPMKPSSTLRSADELTKNL